MKNRKFLLIVSLVLAMTMSLGGTLAYLTDTDADVNVMTLGNVKISQNEQQRVEEDGEFTSVLEPFENDKMLLPVTYPGDRTADTVTVGDYEITLSDDEANYIDKIVSVTNEGNTEAYVRTLVAMPTGGADWEPTPVSANNCWLHWNLPTEYATYWTLVSADVPMIKVDDVNYYVWEFIHKEALPAGETTYPMVRGIYMDNRVDTNDEGEYYLDYGNGTVHTIENFTDADGKVNMLVLSQAVQAAGFASAEAALDEAFGNVNATNAAEWFGGIVNDYPAGGNNPPVIADVTVSNSIELAKALAEAEEGTIIKLNDGTYTVDGDNGKNKVVTLMGSKNAVIKVENESGAMYQNPSDGQGVDYSFEGSTVTFNGLTIDTTGQTGTYRSFARMNGIYNNCHIEGTYTLGTGTSEFNNCTFNTQKDYIWTWGASKAEFNNCTFNNTNSKTILLYGGYNTDLIVNNCTFNAAETGFAGVSKVQPCAAVEIDTSMTPNGDTVTFKGTNTVNENYCGLVRIKSGANKVTITGADVTELVTQ